MREIHGTQQTRLAFDFGEQLALVECMVTKCQAIDSGGQQCSGMRQRDTATLGCVLTVGYHEIQRILLP